MAINTIKATIQMRRGIEQDFDADQMTAGEWAVSTDNQYVRMCFAPGIVVRMATYEAFEQDMKEVQLILATCRDIQTAVDALAKLAEQHKDSAAASALEADNYQKLSKSYAVGTGGDVREGDDIDNSKYYYEQSKRLAQGFNGIMPMGTITFAELSDPLNQVPKYMFNISDSFVSDDRFTDGGGIYYGAGNNVVYTADGMWDALAASAVTGAKGAAETEYRQGNVNISPEDIGIAEATTEKAGLVKPDGKTIMVDQDGTIVGAASGFTGTTAEVEEAISNGEIEEGMIVNITDDYEPPEDITPESIGAVAKAGDEMEGLLWLRRGSSCHLFFATNTSETKLAKIAKITVETAYVDSPLSFTFLSRNFENERRLYIKFANVGSLDTSVQRFSYEGGFIDARIERIAGSEVVFNLYVAFAPFDRVCLTEYHNSYETGEIKVEFYSPYPEAFDDDGTINAIRATLGGRVAEAEHLTYLQSTTKGSIAVNNGEVSDDKNAIGYFNNNTIFNTSQGGGILHHAYDQNWKTQLFVAYMTGEVYSRGKRPSEDGTPWTATRKMLDDKNYTEYVVPKTGGTFSGDVTISGGRSLITYNVKGAGSTLSLLSNSSIDCKKIVSGSEAPSYVAVKAGAFNTVSSARYKENIVDLSADTAIDHIMKYRPVICNYKDDAEKTPIQVFIAEEVAEINPYPVSYDEEGRPDAIDYSKFVPEIISMLQTLYDTTVKQQAEIEELRRKMDAIENGRIS